MENTVSDKGKMKDAIEAYAVARVSGNPLLIKAGIMLVEQWLARLPDNFPPLSDKENPEPVNAEEPAQP